MAPKKAAAKPGKVVADQIVRKPRPRSATDIKHDETLVEINGYLVLEAKWDHRIREGVAQLEGVQEQYKSGAAEAADIQKALIKCEADLENLLKSLTPKSPRAVDPPPAAKGTAKGKKKPSAADMLIKVEPVSEEDMTAYEAAKRAHGRICEALLKVYHRARKRPKTSSTYATGISSIMNVEQTSSGTDQLQASIQQPKERIKRMEYVPEEAFQTALALREDRIRLEERLWRSRKRWTLSGNVNKGYYVPRR
eukprot:NODE_3583_length_1196_cov_61.565704_g3402_i0.p1 GENE.NODE_3583_length_1196_cov_61.565704_g3402_i0~~NODE_3583_length_1196_cov_61.565704_g3402_i0.p1  ORF type:complete len:252 (+),score=51.11 NODE_3583_length_1196_cov_61.565704_g3402_i0:108-863(+)